MNEINPICGKWRVKMRGWWWFWFRDVKYIWQNTDGSIQGYNVLWGWRKWGDFDVEPIGAPCIMGIYQFQYKYFFDMVNLCGDQCRGTLQSLSGKRRATFTMTRILPEIKDD